MASTTDAETSTGPNGKEQEETDAEKRDTREAEQQEEDGRGAEEAEEETDGEEGKGIKRKREEEQREEEGQITEKKKVHFNSPSCVPDYIRAFSCQAASSFLC